MKTLTVRLPDTIADDIELEAARRGLSKSDVVRERLERSAPKRSLPASLADIADVIGCDDEPPADMSGRKKHYLRTLGYGRKRHR